jgi:hypothetical protein
MTRASTIPQHRFRAQAHYTRYPAGCQGSFTNCHHLTVATVCGSSVPVLAFAVDAFQEGEELNGLEFPYAITLTLYYSDSLVTGLNEGSLDLYYWDGSGWSNEGITIVERDPANNRLVVTIKHLSTFALFAEEKWVAYLPTVLKEH